MSSGLRVSTLGPNQRERERERGCGAAGVSATFMVCCALPPWELLDMHVRAFPHYFCTQSMCKVLPALAAVEAVGSLRSPATSLTYCWHACCCYYQLLVTALYAIGIFAATGFYSDGRCACGAHCQCLLRVCFIFRSAYAMGGVQRCFSFRLSYAGVGARMDATWVGVVIKEPEQTYRECHLYL